MGAKSRNGLIGSNPRRGISAKSPVLISSTWRKNKHKIKLTSRFQGEFLELARALAKTNAAYVYKIADKLKGYPNAPTWKKIKNTGNAFKTKSMSDIKELYLEIVLMSIDNNTLYL